MFIYVVLYRDFTTRASLIKYICLRVLRAIFLYFNKCRWALTDVNMFLFLLLVMKAYVLLLLLSIVVRHNTPVFTSEVVHVAKVSRCFLKCFHYQKCDCENVSFENAEKSTGAVKLPVYWITKDPRMAMVDKGHNDVSKRQRQPFRYGKRVEKRHFYAQVNNTGASIISIFEKIMIPICLILSIPVRITRLSINPTLSH